MTIKLGLFWFFNTIMPFVDMGTDFFTVLGLWDDGHNNWAGLSFGVMWNPFLIHIGIFLFNLSTGKFVHSREAWEEIGGLRTSSFCPAHEKLVPSKASGILGFRQP